MAAIIVTADSFSSASSDKAPHIDSLLEFVKDMLILREPESELEYHVHIALRANETSAIVCLPVLLARTWYSTPYRAEESTRRCVLIDWIIVLHHHRRFSQETLYLAVNVIDRYVMKTKKAIPTSQLQLVGCVGLLIASEYEDDGEDDSCSPLSLMEVRHDCDKQYECDLIRDTKNTMLKTLDFKLTISTSHAFMVRYLRLIRANSITIQCTCYTLDCMLLSLNLQQYQPSQLAAAAICIVGEALANAPYERYVWSTPLAEYAEQTDRELTPVVQAVLYERLQRSKIDLKEVTAKWQAVCSDLVALMDVQCFEMARRKGIL